MANKGVPTAAARRRIRENGPEIVRRYEAGESYAAIARSLEVSKHAIADAVKRFGGTPRGRGSYSFPWMMERARQVRERYEAGESLRSIGDDLGVSFTVARMDLLAAGGKTKHMVGDVKRNFDGPDNPAWKGGAHIGAGGYRWVWLPKDHQFACMAPTRGNRVLEHRLVMAQSLGRPLTRSETVHHINGDRLDNRIENLQLRGAAHGQGVAMRCRSCGSQDVGPVEL